MLKLDKIEQDILIASQSGLPVSREFLAEGDAMSQPFARLAPRCLLNDRYLPSVTRISSYWLRGL